jgi:nucleoside-diphosphate-sugar epimerase
MSRYKALIPGATGVVGQRLAEYLAADTDWEVVGIARRPPPGAAPGIGYLAADITDAEACRAALAPVSGVTHVLYAARHDFDTRQPEPVEANTQMLRNVLETVLAGDSALQHVHLVQGTKYYGSQLGPFKTPAREDDPRVPQESFYYDQEDYVIARQRAAAWTWSASRPHGILDSDPRIARGLAKVIAVYAVISKALGEPLCFPGTPENFDALYQCTDATLLAQAIAWMSTDAGCANQAFNITNGDYIRWRNLWPKIADFFEMEPGPVRTIRMAEAMADKAPVWREIVERHGLEPTPYEDLALWPYGDFVFTPGWDIMSATTKARLYGFDACLDTEDVFLGLFQALRDDRVIP